MSETDIGTYIQLYYFRNDLIECRFQIELFISVQQTSIQKRGHSEMLQIRRHSPESGAYLAKRVALFHHRRRVNGREYGVNQFRSGFNFK